MNHRDREQLRGVLWGSVLLLVLGALYFLYGKR